MIGFTGKVLAYTGELSQADFVARDLTYDATLRNLEPIGEAAIASTQGHGEIVKPATSTEAFRRESWVSPAAR